MEVPLACPLCNTGNESISHLFLQCDMSSYIWKKVLAWQGISRMVMDWQEELKWAEVYARGRRVEAEIYRMALAASVYYIWKERNQRVFQDPDVGASCPTASLFLFSCVHIFDCLTGNEQKAAVLQLHYSNAK
ncbi:PREDICTED: uncharacterized protein LOC109224253 [Nicotiana attenuata]|uniref:uncharacterized protein LOC109224253 n=1 Tax=Nicotiana attenuata TaxID=49451 RepID=UPI000905C7EC|nr:PREDICTED: uncharacterized protein LOC109224253 [Nicotiana attenuata]